MEERRDIVLFLGAGFSCDAGLPTMNRFGFESDNRLLDQVNDWNPKAYKEELKFFTKAGYIFKSFQSYCENIENYISFDSNNMEDIFCVADQYRFYDKNKKIKLNFKIDNKIKDYLGLNTIEEIEITELYNYIKRWLWKIYHQLPPLNNKRISETNSDSYNAFFEIIRQIKNRITVITTNYDIVFEYFSYKNNIKSGYPFDANDSDVASIVKNNTAKYLNLFNDNKSPILCKLHGSMNFFINSGKLYICDELDNGLEPRPNLLWVKNGYEIIKDRDIFITPPTYSKLNESNYLKKIWKYANDSLIKAKKIIFIGYSFPESDGYMKSLIQTAMAKRNTTSNLGVYVIDPNLYVHVRYDQLFNPSKHKRIRIEHIVKPFAKSISDIKNMIKT